MPIRPNNRYNKINNKSTYENNSIQNSNTENNNAKLNINPNSNIKDIKLQKKVKTFRTAFFAIVVLGIITLNLKGIINYFNKGDIKNPKMFVDIQQNKKELEEGDLIFKSALASKRD